MTLGGGEGKVFSGNFFHYWTVNVVASPHYKISGNKHLLHKYAPIEKLYYAFIQQSVIQSVYTIAAEELKSN